MRRQPRIVAYRIIFARAERGLGLDLFLRMQRDAHEALQPGKDEAARENERGPIRPVFVLAEPKAPAGSTEPTKTPTAPPPPPSAPLTVDGQVYE